MLTCIFPFGSHQKNPPTSLYVKLKLIVLVSQNVVVFFNKDVVIIETANDSYTLDKDCFLGAVMPFGKRSKLHFKNVLAEGWGGGGRGAGAP